MILQCNSALGELKMEKGQKWTEEGIAKISLAKQKATRAEFDWSRIGDDLWDVVPDLGSRNREKKIISLREFKKLIDSGVPLEALKYEHKISKTLIVFYAGYLRGNIVLSKDDFQRDYLSGLSMEEIAEKRGVSRENLTVLRQFYGIKNKGATYIHRKKTESSLTARQWQILSGSLLGDASKMSPSSIRFKQGDPQKDYLTWKAKEFENLLASPLRSEEAYDDRYKKNYTSWVCFTSANSDIESINSIYYPQDKPKGVPPDWYLDKMNELALAVWFMDDGKTDFHYYSPENYSPESYFCTDSFSEEDVGRLIKWLKKFDINGTPAKSSIGKPRIRVGADSIRKLFQTVEPHIIPSMRYKINREEALLKNVMKEGNQEETHLE